MDPEVKRLRLAAEVADELEKLRTEVHRIRTRIFYVEHRIRAIDGKLVGTPDPGVVSSLNAVLAATAAYFDVSVDNILGKSRKSLVARARHVVMFVYRQMGMSLTEIGKRLGRDHSSVHHGCQRVSGDDEMLRVAGLMIVTSLAKDEDHGGDGGLSDANDDHGLVVGDDAPAVDADKRGEALPESPGFT